MLHPSYTDLMKVVNQEAEEGNSNKAVNSRYSIVLATSKRARQIIDGAEPMVDAKPGEKPLSVAIKELNEAQLKIEAGEAAEEEELDAVEE
ncbi:MAG: DNA-directed RNA polymerase subunit omega [Ruminococcus sp.]|nr:DNA-directed RNA polymerase subunit omega [Ruminococcus sp.]